MGIENLQPQNNQEPESPARAEKNPKNFLDKAITAGALGATLLTAEGCKPENPDPISTSNQIVENVQTPDSQMKNYMDRLLDSLSFHRMAYGDNGNVYFEYYGDILSLDADSQIELQNLIKDKLAQVGPDDTRSKQNLIFNSLKLTFDERVGQMGVLVKSADQLPDDLKQRFNDLEDFKSSGHFENSTGGESDLNSPKNDNNNIRVSPSSDREIF